MKKIFIIFILLLKISYAQTTDWIWAKSAGGTKEDLPQAITIDDLGNTYITGFFTSPTLILGSDTLTNAYNSYADLFISKIDNNGNVLWANSIIGSRDDRAYCITTDDSGNVYISGHFASLTLGFGPFVLTNTGGYDIFIAKYDNNGNVIWAKSAGGTNNDWMLAIEYDPSGYLYTSGSFFSPSIIFGLDTLINHGNGTCDIMITKYDLNGNAIWAKNYGGTDWDGSYCNTLDASGNIFVAGYYQSPSIIIGTDTFTNNGVADFLITKIDSNGNILWSRNAGGTKDDWAVSISPDTDGNIYVTGPYYSPTITFDTTTLINADGLGTTTDMFLTKYDNDGNMLWSKRFGGTANDWVSSLSIDYSSNIYLAGSFYSTIVDIDSLSITNNGSRDIFIAKFNNTCNVLFAVSAGGSGWDEVNSITIDSSENIYVCGDFGTSSLSLGSSTLQNVGQSDIFFAKLGITTSIHETSNSFDFSAYPNPCTDNITINVPKETTVEVSTINGQIIKSIDINSKSTTVNLTGLSSGVYIVRLITDKEIVTKKIIKE